MSIYIYKNNQQFGPYRMDTVHEWLLNGELSPNDLAIKEGMTEWQPLEMVLFGGTGLQAESEKMEDLDKGIAVQQALRSTIGIKKESNELYETLNSRGYRKHSSFSEYDLRAIDVAKDLYERDQRDELVAIVVYVESKEEYVFYTLTQSAASAAQSKSGCFIATAAYGSPLAQEVIFLSRFRDEFLLKSKIGASFVSFYYYASPPLALLIGKVRFLRVTTRTLFLTPILRLLKYWMFKN